MISNDRKHLSTNLPFNTLSYQNPSRYCRISADKRWEVISSSRDPSNLLKKLCEDLYPGFEFINEGIERTPKVLLVGAYEPSDLPAGRFDTPPYGLQRIASFLRAAGINADIFPVTSLGRVRLLNLVKKQKFEFIGFSVLGPTLPFDIQLTHEVKAVQKKATLIVGGAVPTAKPSLLTSSAIDYLITGYGEDPLLNLIVEKNKVRSGCVNKIKGVYTRDKLGNFRGLPAEVPTYNDLRIYSYLLNPSIGIKYTYNNPSGLYNRFPSNRTKVYRIMGQGFCPKKCSFCSTRNFLRNATKETVLPYISLLPKDRINIIINILRKLKGVKTIFISDDDFFTDSKVAGDFFRMIIHAKRRKQINKKTSFILSARIDEIESKILSLAKKAGVILINIGVESFSKRSLTSLSKNVENRSEPMNDFINESLAKVLNNNIIPSINLILFHPYTDWNQIYITARNALSFVEDGGEVNMTTYIRYYYGADILNDKTVPVLKYIMPITRANNSIFLFENKIALLPKSLKMQEFARDIIVRRSLFEEQIKQMYKYSFKRAPHKVIQLVFLKAIFEEASKYKFIDSKTTRSYVDKIDTLIEIVFKDLGYIKVKKINNKFCMVSIPSGHKQEAIKIVCNLHEAGFDDFFIKLIFDFRTCLLCSLFNDKRFNRISPYLRYLFFIKEKSRFYHLNSIEKTIIVRSLFDVYSFSKKQRKILFNNLGLIQEDKRKWIKAKEKIKLLIKCKGAFRSIIISPEISRNIKLLLNKILEQEDKNNDFCYKLSHGREVLSYNARIN